jgi:hypothetical protein
LVHPEDVDVVVKGGNEVVLVVLVENTAENNEVATTLSKALLRLY